MAKGMAYYLRQAWKKPDEKRLRELMIKWRAGKKVEKVGKPLRIDRARALGYKAKGGFVVARVVILRGGRKRPKTRKGRKTRKQTNKKILKMSYRWVAEIRAQKKFPNLEVLNSYLIGKDGKNYFFEVILVDPNMPEIKSDRHINWICRPENRKRVFRGLTSAAKKSRGLGSKSRNIKVRPSLRAWGRRGK